MTAQPEETVDCDTSSSLHRWTQCCTSGPVNSARGSALHQGGITRVKVGPLSCPPSFLALLREDSAVGCRSATPTSVSAHLPVLSTALVHLRLEAAAAGLVFDSLGRLYKLALYLKGCWWTRAQLPGNMFPHANASITLDRTHPYLSSEGQKRKWVLETDRWGRAGGT